MSKKAGKSRKKSIKSVIFQPPVASTSDAVAGEPFHP